VNSF